MIAPPLAYTKTLRDEIKERKEAEERERKKKLAQRQRDEEIAAYLAYWVYNGETPPPRWTGDPRKVLKFEADKAREAQRLEEAQKRAEEKKIKDAEREAARKAEAEEAARLRALKTPVTEKIAASVGARVDKIVAWFQVHPEIGIKMDAFFTKAGRLFVRCVFYPLMVMIPLSVLGYVGYLVSQHIHGVTGAGGGFVHGMANIADATWKPGLLTFGALILFIALLTSIALLAWKASVHAPGGEYDVPPSKDLRLWKPRKRDAVVGTAIPMKTVYKQGWVHLSKKSGAILDKVFADLEVGASRTYKVLTPVGHGIDHAFDGGVWAAIRLGRGIRGVYRVTVMAIAAILSLFVAILQFTGRSMKSTGQFFVIGHHAVKYRTCPRIQIVEENN